MRRFSYAPYSKFHVGAALLAEDGMVYTGCNIENSSYGATNCAERTAFFKAVSDGAHSFRAIAIAGGMEAPDGSLEQQTIAPPCGICRQVMSEFCGPDFEIVLLGEDGNPQIHTLSELLPLSFSKDKLNM